MNPINLFFLGVLATLPMGPAGFNVASSCVKKQEFPKRAFTGFLVAEMVYLMLAFMLKDLFLAEIVFWKLVTSIIAGLFITLFGVYIIQKKKRKDSELPTPASGFKKSFLITLSNPSILILHLTIILQVQHLQAMSQVTLVGSFLLGGVCALLFIIAVLLYQKKFFFEYGARIEKICGWLLFFMGSGLLIIQIQKVIAGV